MTVEVLFGRGNCACVAGMLTVGGMAAASRRRETCGSKLDRFMRGTPLKRKPRTRQPESTVLRVLGSILLLPIFLSTKNYQQIKIILK